MEQIGILILIIALFFILGWSANIIVDNIKVVAHRLGVPIFALGLFLGLLTSLPELSIGLNSLMNDLTILSVGNLFGGIVVIFCLILGLGILLNRSVKTDGKFKNVLPIISYLFLPFILGIDGSFNFIDSLIFIGLYFVLFYYLFQEKKHLPGISVYMKPGGKSIKEISLVFLGIVAVVLVSNFIIRLTLMFLNSFSIPTFFIGLIIFSLGTNLPEIIITFKSWKKKANDLSLSHILGSAMANILILGLLGLFKTISFNVDFNYLNLVVFSLIMYALVGVFYSTDKKFTRIEGVVLTFLYIIFVIIQFI